MTVDGDSCKNAMAEQALDGKELRRALGSFVTGVTVVTCRVDGEPVGLTVNSFNSVSLAPPLVLWSLSRTAASYEAFMRAPHFVVNVLAADQQALSDRFAQTGGNKFGDLRYAQGIDDIPILENVAAHFVCRKEACHPGGDHVIFLGTVLDYAHSTREPLVYARGRYMRVRDHGG